MEKQNNLFSSSQSFDDYYKYLQDACDVYSSFWESKIDTLDRFSKVILFTSGFSIGAFVLVAKFVQSSNPAIGFLLVTMAILSIISFFNGIIYRLMAVTRSSYYQEVINQYKSQKLNISINFYSGSEMHTNILKDLEAKKLKEKIRTLEYNDSSPFDPDSGAPEYFTKDKFFKRFIEKDELTEIGAVGIFICMVQFLIAMAIFFIL